MLEDSQNVKSQCVPEGMCRHMTCSRPHAKCVDLDPGKKGYDELGRKDQGIGYSCVEKCHEVGFDHFEWYWWHIGFSDTKTNQTSSKSLKRDCLMLKPNKVECNIEKHPMAKCKNLPEGETGKKINGDDIEDGPGYSCVCGGGTQYNEDTKECGCSGYGYIKSRKMFDF